MESYRPMSSSPPGFDGYSPSGSQDRSDREHPSEDHARKRRRIEPENPHVRNMPDSSNIPPHPRRYDLPAHYGFFTAGLHGISPASPLGLPIGTFLEEDAAIEYLSSGTGFAQDLRGIDLRNMDFNQPLHPSMFAVGDRTSPSTALTSHPAAREGSELSMLRPLSHDYIIASRLGIPTRQRGDNEDVAEAPGRAHPPAPSYDLSGPSSYRSPAFPAHYQIIEGSSPPRRHPSIHPNTPTTVPKEPATMLILSRASEESIEALDEHKRECPTCCLEFEPDNFVAVITCCHMVMHARCLSAWVNSAGYSKSRACMKCRRNIDAKYMLNKVIPVVTDKEWDEGGDFNAPESLQGDSKIELNVTARRPRGGSHRSRGGIPLYRFGRDYLQFESLTQEQKDNVNRLRELHSRESSDVRARRQIALDNNNRLNHEDLEANRVLVEAQTHATEEELTALLQRTRETRMARDVGRDAYTRVQMEADALQRAHQRRVSDLLAQFYAEREARELEAQTQISQSATSAPIPMPQLRVVNGEASSSASSDEV